VFTQPGGVKESENVLKTKKQYSCEICSDLFENYNSLRNHKRSYHKETQTCKECGFKTHRPEVLKDHKRTHTGEKPFACDLCEIRLGHRSTYNKHMQTQHGWKIPSNGMEQTCEICGKMCGNLGGLALHMKSHTTNSNSNSQCSICGENFPSLKELSKHKNKSHAKKDDEPKTKFCEICNKTFASRQSFRHHTITTHTKVFPVICDSCGKGFTGTGLGETLEKHKKTCSEKL